MPRVLAQNSWLLSSGEAGAPHTQTAVIWLYPLLHMGRRPLLQGRNPLSKDRAGERRTQLLLKSTVFSITSHYWLFTGQKCGEIQFAGLHKSNSNMHMEETSEQHPQTSYSVKEALNKVTFTFILSPSLKDYPDVCAPASSKSTLCYIYIFFMWNTSIICSREPNVGASFAWWPCPGRFSWWPLPPIHATAAGSTFSQTQDSNTVLWHQLLPSACVLFTIDIICCCLEYFYLHGGQT